MPTVAARADPGAHPQVTAVVVAHDGARWLPALLWLALVLTLTSIPNPSVPNVAGGDKVAHVIMYGVFGATVTYGLAAGPHTARRLLVAFLATAGVAAANAGTPRCVSKARNT